MDSTPHTITNAYVRQVVPIASQYIVSTKNVQLVLIHEVRSIRSSIRVVLGESVFPPCKGRDIENVEVHRTREDVIKLNDTPSNQKLVVIQSRRSIRTGFRDEAVRNCFTPEKDGGVTNIAGITRIADACACDWVAAPVDALAGRALVTQAIRQDRRDGLHQFLDVRIRLVELQTRYGRQYVLLVAC